MNMHKVLKQFTSQTDIIGLISLIEHFFFPSKSPLGKSFINTIPSNLGLHPLGSSFKMFQVGFAKKQMPPAEFEVKHVFIRAQHL